MAFFKSIKLSYRAVLLFMSRHFHLNFFSFYFPGVLGTSARFCNSLNCCTTLVTMKFRCTSSVKSVHVLLRLEMLPLSTSSTEAQLA